AQGHFDVPDTINTIGGHPGKRDTLCQRPLDHGTGKRRFGGEAGFRWHMDLAARSGLASAIGRNRTSAGTRKTELSTKAMMASHQSADFLAASEIVQS